MYKITVDYSPSEKDDATVKEGLVTFNEKIMGEREKPLSVFFKK